MIHNTLDKLAIPLGLAFIAFLLAGDWPQSQAQTPGDASINPQGEQVGLRNLLRLSDRIYSGSQPEAEADFAQLKSLRIKTVVSVDGSKPALELARQHGLRYVHIPIGYDGISEHSRLSLARLVRDLDGPFYIHCHRGRHRGPAAAAVACLAAEEIDQPAALQFLETAGTGKEYAGLWQAVELYRVPPRSAKLPELVEVAETDSLAAAMARIDRAYENLVHCRDAGWKAPVNRPDLVAQQQALQLKEGFLESLRHRSDPRQTPFKAWLTTAQATAQRLETALANSDRPTAEQEFGKLKQSCTRCHTRFRD